MKYLLTAAVFLCLFAFALAGELESTITPGVVPNTPTTPVAARTTEQDPFDPVMVADGRWLMSRDRERAYRGMFPRTGNADINAVLANPDLILYTDVEIPLARQNWSNVSSGLHSMVYDLSGGADQFGRGSAHEFPWADPAGTHQVPSRELVEVRAMLLPEVDGVRKPIVYWTSREVYASGMFDARRTKIEWTYPHGTVFLELLGRKMSNGNTVTFELRVRTRERNSWSVDVFRPYVHWQDLQQALVSLDHDESQRLALRPIIRSATLHDTTHTGEQEIELTANYEQLPTYPDSLVETLLLNRTFESALGEEWREGVATPAGGVNPSNYRAIMDVDSLSCIRCHESTNRHVSHFQLQRDWYGNVRGSDHILSFHVFDPSCVSPNGMNKTVAYRKELVLWDLLEQYDPRKHPNSVYSALEN